MPVIFSKKQDDMIKNYTTLLLVLGTILLGTAQTSFKGKVLDANNQQAIEFVNIGVIGSNKGTVSNEQGLFSLKNISDTASIKFSSIGYEAKTISATTLKINPTVALHPVSYQVATVNINAQQFGQEKKIGKEIKRKNTIWGLPFSYYLGAEIGMRIKINQETSIKSVHFGMHARSPDSILFRVNLYDYKNGKAGKNLITKNVYAYTHEVADYGTIDLSDLNIVVYDDVLLSLQIVKRDGVIPKDGIAKDGILGDEYIMFRIKTWLYDSNILYREASQTEFRNPKRGVVNDRIAFYLMGRQAGKTKRLNSAPTSIIEAKPILNTWQDSLALLFKKSTIPGLAITVIKKDSLVFQQTYGQANVAEDRPYTHQTTQPIASISKTFIGLALMQLIEKGHFTLETPINDLLPFKVINPHQPQQAITVKHLVTHSAGIYDTTAYYGQYHIQKGENLALPTVKAMLKEGLLVREETPLGDYLKAVFSPDGDLYSNANFLKEGADTIYSYSNIGASLAAYLVEITTKKPYTLYVQENIFQPLGMRNSSFDRKASSSNQRATLYASKSHPFPEYHHPSYPDGWGNTTNEDMGLYLLDMLKGAKGEGKLLSKSGYQTLFSRKSPTIFNGKNGDVHGVFWDLVGNRIQHSGGDYGILSFNPTTDSGYYMVSNINPDTVGKELQIDGGAIFDQLLTMLELVEDFETVNK